MKTHLPDIIRLHLVIFIYSLSTVFAKLAGMQDIHSAVFFAFVFLMFLFLALYAVLWQKALGRFALSVAYANRAADLLWGLVFGAAFFGERISVRSAVCVILVFFGIVLVVRSDE